MASKLLSILRFRPVKAVIKSFKVGSAWSCCLEDSGAATEAGTSNDPETDMVYDLVIPIQVHDNDAQ